MAPKTKEVKPAVGEPEAKKAKTDEPKAEEEPKEPKFEEPDAPKDNRPTLKDAVAFSTPETTLNVVPTMGGKLLTAITAGGMSFLLAGARANVGVKAGRYMFEVKIVENLSSGNDKSKPMLRVGFSKAGSSLFLGEDAGSVSFDSEGIFMSDKKRMNLPGKARFGKDKTVAVVLNLDPKSPNANTVNMYLNGELVTDPKPLPEGLKGEALFPHVTYRGATIQVNFGPAPLKDLPFKCTMVQEAAGSDVKVAASQVPKDGKYEVMLPVAFPDEGTFEWLDGFLESNPKYVELSDRKLAEWCKSSGLQGKGMQGSNDKPQGGYGLPGLDDFSVRKIVSAVAPCIPRNYLIMEVKSNLIAAERQATLKKFNYPCYKKVAHVVMGKPNAAFTDKVQGKILKAKQARSDAAWKNEQKRKEAEKKRKELEKKRKADIEAKRKAKEEAEKKAKEAAEKKEGDEKKEEPKEEEKKEEPKEEEAEEEMETEPPAVELTEEEKATCFSKKTLPDIAPNILNGCFGKFTTPEEVEGFDTIRYEWEKADAAEAYLKNWVLSKKLTTRIENIKPGQFFKDKNKQFEKEFKEWQDKQKAAKPPAKKKGDDEVEQDIDIYGVADICDIGGGVPLFSQFTWEDWELVKTRFELGLLLASFKKDCDDPDRTGIPVDHLSWYMSRYFSKNLNLKTFGAKDQSEVFALVKDTVAVKDAVLVSQLSEDIESLDIFVKLAEEHRRERQRRIDAGDETARLKFAKPVEKPKAPVPAPKPAVAAPKPGAPKPGVPAPKAEPKTVAPKPAVGIVPAKGKGKAKK